MTATQAGYIKKVLLHAAIFAALTLPFYFFNLDMKIESWFFNLNAFKWYLQIRDNSRSDACRAGNYRLFRQFYFKKLG